MNRIYIIICLFFICTSCSDWLDVSPESEVVEEDMFNSEAGFKDALVGVYSLMAQQGVYGGNLTMGTLDVLAQNYNVRFNNNLNSLANFEYDKGTSEAHIDQIWSGLYNAIANSNNIIEHIEKKSEHDFMNSNYNIVYAEALGIRAFLHFDLLRMFNAPYATNPDFLGIPYVTEFSKDVSEQSTSRKTISLILDDLTKAIDLVANVDPILDDKESNLPTNLFLMNRYNRMNIYALKALKARVSLYVGDKKTALENAKEVIDSDCFSFVKPNEVVYPNDYAFKNEHIFSVYTFKLKDNSNYYFAPKGTQRLFISSVYEDAFLFKEDVRYKYWLKEDMDQYKIMRLFVNKYNRPEDEEKADDYPDPNIPLIKLSEMYLIASECLAETSTTEALKYYNDFITKRELNPLENVDGSGELMDHIKREYQRDFLSEGQTFYMYKRLALESITNYSGVSVEMNDSKYTFPLPKDEVQFGGRK